MSYIFLLKLHSHIYLNVVKILQSEDLVTVIFRLPKHTFSPWMERRVYQTPCPTPRAHKEFMLGV